jgi:Flp pilus assembly protein TadG
MRQKDGRTERGAAAVEAALMLSLIILPLIFGIMDFSRAMYAYHFVAYAAREGSRWASVRGSTCAAPMTNCGAAAFSSTSIQTFVTGIAPPGMYATSCGASPGSLCATILAPNGKQADGTTDCTNGGAFVNDFPGCVVTVQVTYRYHFSLPFISQLGTTLMSSTSEMTISQ